MIGTITIPQKLALIVEVMNMSRIVPWINIGVKITGIAKIVKW